MTLHRFAQASRFVALLIAVVVAAAPSPALAADRVLITEKDASDALKQIVATLQDTTTAPIPYEDLTRTSDYFVRIAPRKYVLTRENEIADSAVLGTKPFVFVTTPESLYGKSLLEIYLDIGYEAEDIIRWQRDEDMVAIVFRYPQAIRVSEERDGALPEGWRQMLFVPTWDNVFVLFEKLAAEATIEADKQGEYQPETLFFRSEPERYFVLGFPADAKERMKTLVYADMRALGGADWIYRRLLENKLSVFEHFRGNGRTLNEIVDPDGTKHDAGLLEFVGPNKKVKELAEVAVVHLGALTIADTYSAAAE